jgi:hypothetical protein
MANCEHIGSKRGFFSFEELTVHSLSYNIEDGAELKFRVKGGKDGSFLLPHTVDGAPNPHFEYIYKLITQFLVPGTTGIICSERTIAPGATKLDILSIEIVPRIKSEE